MKTENNINHLDEALRIAWLEDLLVSPGDPFVMMDAGAGIGMGDAKKMALINQLYERVTVLSFGELLSKTMADEAISIHDISGAVELQPSYIESLQRDKIAVNNVPVLILQKILTHLKISFTQAQSAILKTFEILRNSISESEEDIGVSPAFRKGRLEAGSASFKRLPNKDLFENEESLKKYLSRLEKLMQ